MTNARHRRQFFVGQLGRPRGLDDAPVGYANAYTVRGASVSATVVGFVYKMVGSAGIDNRLRHAVHKDIRNSKGGAVIRAVVSRSRQESNMVVGAVRSAWSWVGA